MDEEEVNVHCRFCGDLIATFDDIVAYREYGLLFFKKVCNMKVLGRAEFLLNGTLMGCLYCKCKLCRGLGPLEVSGGGAIGNNDELEKFYALIFDQVILMRGRQQLVGRSSEAAALIEKGCKRYEQAKEKGKSPVVADDALEAGPFNKIYSEFSDAVKKLMNIDRLSEFLGNEQCCEAMAKQIPQVEDKLISIETEIEDLQTRALSEAAQGNSSEEVTRELERIGRKLGIIASLLERFEGELVADFYEKQASDVPEKTPKESGTAIEAITEQAAHIGLQLLSIGSDFVETEVGSEQDAAQVLQQLQYIRSELAETENVDTRQTSDDEVEKETGEGESGEAIEEKTSSSGAAGQKKSRAQKRKQTRRRRR